MQIETLVIVVTQIVDALKRNGYDKDMHTVHILSADIRHKFDVERLSDLSDEQVADVEMYLNVWEPTAAQRFRMREFKIVKQ